MVRALAVAVVVFVVAPVSSAGAEPSMRFEGRAAPYAAGVVSDGRRYVAFETRKGERRLTQIIDARTGRRFRVRTPHGCSSDWFEGAGLVGIGGGNVLWDCLPHPGWQTHLNDRKDARLFDLAARGFRPVAGLSNMRDCYDHVEWTGVGLHWIEASVGQRNCDRGAVGPRYLNHRTGEVVTEGFSPRTDQAPNLDAEVVVETLCSGLRREVTEDGFPRPFQFQDGFGIGPWEAYRDRSTLLLQRCNRPATRVAYCRHGCFDVQLGERSLTWLGGKFGAKSAYGYSLTTRKIDRWAVPDAYSVAHTRRRIFVLSGDAKNRNQVRSAALPRHAVP